MQIGYPNTRESEMEFELRQPRYGVDRRLHLVLSPDRLTEGVPYASAPGIPVLNYLILSVMLIFTFLMYQQARASHAALSVPVLSSPGTAVVHQQQKNHSSPPPSAVAVLRLASCAALANHQGERR